jgi:formylglycine-generating enzyme required for sulfatase activity
MGYSSLKTMVSVIRGEKVEPVIHSTMALITATGVEFPLPRPAIVPAPTTREIESPKLKLSTPLENKPPSVTAAADFTIPDLQLPLVAIAPGTFNMGPPKEGDNRGDELPRTKVTLSGFWLGKYELTQAQWLAITGANPSEFKSDTRPVENISWNDAVEFCRRLTDRERTAGRLPPGFAYTLPTEAQWEYACRAGTTTAYAGNPVEIGWFATNSGAVDPATGIWRMSTHPVGEKKPNAWGLYDMCGNVTEWCLDWYGDYSGGEFTDPIGPASGTYRVLRGGCWWADVQNCRSDSRHKGPPGRWHSALGMRVALSAMNPASP